MRRSHIAVAALTALTIIFSAGGATGAPLSITPQYANYITPTVGTPYSITIRSVNGQGPFTWSISAGSLPPGITINPSTGVLSGTATAPGSYEFTIKVTDTLSATATYQMAAYVDPQTNLAQTFLYTTQLTGASEHGNGVSLQANGNLNIAGGTEPSNPTPNRDYLAQITTGGTIVWSTAIQQASTAKDTIGVATDYAGNTYALTEYVPSSGVGLTHMAWVRPTIGNPWTRPFADAAQNGFITANDYGDIFVTLFTQYGTIAAQTDTMKIDQATGTVLWKDTYTGDADCPLFKSYANKTDDEGNIYIAGSCTLSDLDKTTFGAVRKLDANGTFLWQNPYIPTGTCSGGNCPIGSELNTTTGLCEAPAVHYPSCPGGLTYNSTLTICQGNPAHDCPTGTSYDGSLCYSTPTTTHTCQTGFTYNASSDRCEAPATATCPTGSTYNASSTYCEAAPGPGQDCQAGFTYDPATQKCAMTPNCITGSTLNTQRGACQENPIVDMLCPAGTTWNSTTSKCQALSTCPSSVPFNPTTNLCEAQPTCPGGAAYNPATNRCEAASTGVTQCTVGTYNSVTNKCESTPLSGPTCSPNTTYNAAAYQCEGPPTCITGGSYNTATDQCEANPACPTSTAFNNATNMCEATGTPSYNCSTGIYNSSTGKCEAAYNMTCPTGTTWNSSTLKCQATPTCSIGGSYDLSTHVCDANPACPSGTSFSNTTNQCEGIGTPNYNCSAGAYNASTGKCETASTTTCPNGFILNASKCEADPACDTPGTFDFATNKCQASISCPTSSSYYFTTKICESAQQGNSCDYPLTYAYDSTYKACTAQPSQVTCPGTGPYNHYNNDGVNCASSAYNFTCPAPGYYEANLSRCASTTNTSPYTMNQCWFDTITQTTICRYVGGNPTSATCWDPTYTFTSAAYDCYRAATGITCPNQGTIHTGAQLGWCYLPATNACPTGTTFTIEGDVNYTNGHCTASPICPLNYVFNPALSICEESAPCPSGSALNTQTHKCEIQGTHTCTTGFTYNPSTTKCEATPTVTYSCPTGTSWNGTTCTGAASCPATYTIDTVTHKCETASTCVAGTTFNPANDKCEATGTQTCPGTLTYNPSTAKCEGTPTVTYSCPTGTSWNGTVCSSTTTCPTNYTLNLTTHKCAVASTCPAYTSLNMVADRCEGPPAYTCPNGLAINITRQICEANPTVTQTCPTGTTYNGTLCTATAQCYPGLSLNTTTDLCQAAPTCPTLTTFNPVTRICEGTGTPQYSCLPGFTYASAVQKCEAAPTCSTGTYNPATVKCEMMPTGTTCVAGTTYDVISGKCRATQTYNCSTGTLDDARRICYLTATQNQDCPPSTIYNSTSTHCEAQATIECPPTSTYNDTMSKCEAVAGDGVNCPTLFTYDQGGDICTKQQGGGCVPNAAAGSIDIDWYGDLYVFLHAEELDGNRSVLMKISNDGAILWENTSSELMHAFQTDYTRVARDDSGYVYVNGTYTDNTTNSKQIAALAYGQQSGTYYGKKTFAISGANAYLGGAVGNPTSGSTFAGTADYSGSLKKTLYGRYAMPTAIVDAAPSFSPAAGTYNTIQAVTVRTTTPGAAIIYTTDGSMPSPTHGTAIASGTAITVDHGLTIRAIAYLNQVGNAPSAVTTATYILRAATPTFSVPTGTYNTTKTVTIRTTTTNATIAYTTDGSAPSSTNGTKIASGTTITIDKTTTLQAMALAPSAGWTDSTIATATYTLTAATPTVSPVQGTYGAPQTVTITDTTPGAVIAYTTDGTTPSHTAGTQVATGAKITINATTTLKAIAFVPSGWSDSPVLTATYTLKVATPTYAPVAGTYTTPQSVKITTTTPSATLVYTTDGSTPTRTNGTTVQTSTVTIAITATTTLKTMAYVTTPGWTDSAIASGTYTMNTAAPTLTPGTGSYGVTQTVTLKTTTPNATIAYTTDGSTPSRTNGTQVTSGTTLNVDRSETIKAMAFMATPGWNDSATTTATYTMKVATPTLAPAGGIYTTPQTVTMKTTTPGATIAYTTDGSVPSKTNGTQVTSGTTLSVNQITTLKAIAFMATGGWTDSATATGTYTFNTAAPTITPGTGSYGVTQAVTIKTTTADALIRYTTDGSTPSSSNGTIISGGSGTLTINQSMTVKAIAYMTTNWNPSTVTTATYTMKVATPTLAPAGGTYTTPQTVTIKTTTPNATIAYTTDGSTPSSTNGTQITSGTTLSVNQITTLKAIAFMASGGWTDSATATGTYTFNTVAPTITPGTATYSTPQTVTIKTTTAGALIRYTTDGSTPSSTNGTIISGGTGTLTVNQTTTLKAIAYMTTNWNPSTVTTATYTMKAATPTATPAAGNYTTPQTVTIKTTTPGASISYTTDNTTPTKTNGTIVASGSTISIGQNTPLRAIAFITTGWNDSAVLTANYTLTVTAPTFTPGGTTYSANTVVTIRSATASAVINYTTDGSTPSRSNGTQIANGATVTITATTTLKAIAYMATQNWNDSTITTAIYTLKPVAPTFSPAAGTYTTNQNVTMSSTTAGAQIIYTLDGSTPTTTNGTQVSSGTIVPVTRTTTLKAISHMPSGTWTDSAVTTAVYTMRAGTPVFAPMAGTYSTPQTVTITATGPATTRIRYTTDGTTPTTTLGTDTANGSTIPVNATQTIRAIAYVPDGTWTTSAVAIATYTMKVATPTLSKPGGTYTGGTLIITPSDTTPGIDYFAYLTGATTPTCTTGTQLTPGNSITLTTGVTTLRVIACRSGWTASAAVAATYTINP